MSANLTPLEVAKQLFGSVEIVSISAGMDRKTAFKWVYASSWRDAGDFPSPRTMRRLLDHSEAHDLGLTAEHLLRGASQDEINAILRRRKVAAA